MAQKSSNSNLETLDLTLRLVTDKGKRPIVESPQEPKRRKVEEKPDEEDSTGRSSEDRLTKLEQKVNLCEKLLHDLSRKIDANFTHVSNLIFYQQSVNTECLKKVQETLQQVTQSIRPLPSSSSPKNIPSGSTPSTTKKPPRP